MLPIFGPRDMNRRFAEAFNARDLDQLLSFHEPAAAHYNGRQDALDRGHDAIRAALRDLIAIPGKMQSINSFCLMSGDLALLRADWRITSPDGKVLFSGSSMEVARRQVDGRWLTVIDHALGASLPSVNRVA